MACAISTLLYTPVSVTRASCALMSPRSGSSMMERVCVDDASAHCLFLASSNVDTQAHAHLTFAQQFFSRTTRRVREGIYIYIYMLHSRRTFGIPVGACKSAEVDAKSRHIFATDASYSTTVGKLGATHSCLLPPTMVSAAKLFFAMRCCK